jgi:hypothetical protein
MTYIQITMMVFLTLLVGCTTASYSPKRSIPEKGITMFGPDEPTTNFQPVPGDPLYSHQHTPYGKHYPGH